MKPELITNETAREIINKNSETEHEAALCYSSLVQGKIIRLHDSENNFVVMIPVQDDWVSITTTKLSN